MKDLIIPRVSAQFMESEAAAEMYVDDRLTGDGQFVTLDKPGSVSGLIRFDLVSSQAVRRIRINLLKGVHHGS